MFRWCSAAAFLAAPALLLFGANPAAAQTQYTITIILTTLGTDGTPVVTAAGLPADSSVSVKTDPSGTSQPASAAGANTPNASNGGGSGSGGGGGGSNGSNTAQSLANPPVPSGATGNPTIDGPNTTTTSNDPTTPEIPTFPEEPTAPEPPVLTPVPPVVDTPTTVEPPIVDVPVENTTGVPTATETPEPATLTLAVLGALGAAGIYRRRKV